MRFLRAVLIVVAVTALGALIPFLFRERWSGAIGSALVCDMLASGERIGALPADARNALLDATIASATMDERSRSLLKKARDGGCAERRGT